MDSIRFHDGSPYEQGFQVGYLLRPRHALPASPFREGSRAGLRWAKGLHDGREAHHTRVQIMVARCNAEAQKRREKLARESG